MTNDETFNKIEAWLSGELPDAESQAFEAEMAADPALAAEVERHRRGREALDRLAEQAMQADMARWRESMDELPEPPLDATPAGPSNRLRWMPGALLLILLAGAVYWLWPPEKPGAGMTPVQESTPPNNAPPPIAVTPQEEPAKEVQNPKQRTPDNSAQLIAMAETNLKDLHGAILQQYGQTMGDEEEENPWFKSGVKAFEANNLKTAKKDLQQVVKTDPFFPSAQEILASIYLGEKNYPKAVLCYENFARQNAAPVTDWRLLQFYLADYPNHKTDFAKKLSEIADPANHHRYQKDVETLKRGIEKMGIK